MMIVRAQAFRSQPMRRIFHSCKTASAIQEGIIPLSFFSLPDPGFAIRMIGIVMVLVYRLYDGCRIDNAST